MTNFKFVAYQMQNLQITILVILISLLASSVNAQYSEAIMTQDSIIKAKYDNYESTNLNRRKAPNKLQSTWLQNNGFYIIDYNWDNENINLHLGKALNNNAASKALLKGAIPTLVLGGIFQMASVLGNESLRGNTIYRKLYAATGGFLFTAFLSNAAGISNIKKAKIIRDKNLNLLSR